MQKNSYIIKSIILLIINIYIIFFLKSLKYKDKNEITLLNAYYNNLDKFYNNSIFNYYKIGKRNIFCNLKNSKIQNIFLLIGILPLIKKYSLIIKIKYKSGFELIKNIFPNKKIKNDIMRINLNDYNSFINKFNLLLKFKWDLMPKQDIIDKIRYIINNFYNEYYLDIFDNSLVLNLKYYINNNKYKFSINDISKLMSKIILFKIFIKKI